jgi:hypothetical protein
MRIWDSPGPAPAFMLLVSINAPVALARGLWSGYLWSIWWDNPLLIVALGFFWYWVALNFDSWRQQRSVFMFSWTPLRLVGDAVLIAVGVFWSFNCVAAQVSVTPYRGLFPPHITGWMWFIASVGFQLAWALVLIFFFGRDLIHCVLKKKSSLYLPVQG